MWPNLKHSDQNYSWGATAPERIFTWGETTARTTVMRHFVDAKSIVISGPLSNVPQIPEKITVEAARRPLRVLWADQPIVDQNKAPAEAWIREHAEIAKNLSQYQTTLRFHPSSRRATKSRLREAIGDKIQIDDGSSYLLSEEYLRSYDIVFTYYSTVFLSAIAAGIPCVLYQPPLVDILLPKIDHPLLSYAANLAEVNELLNKRMLETEAREVSSGEAIGSYVSAGDGAVAVCNFVKSELKACKDRLSRKASGSGFKPSITDLRNIERLRNSKILILAGSFGYKTGVARSLLSFVDTIAGEGLTIDFQLATSGSLGHVLSGASDADIVIINSFDTVRLMGRNELADLMNELEHRGVPVFFYCHETEFVYNALRKSISEKMDAFFKNHLPRMTALAANEQQAEWLCELGAKRVSTIYECIDFEPETRSAADQGDPPTIVMVGTQQPRKGVDLFSRVADRAKANGKNWRFVWIGGYTPLAANCYKSEHVTWLGSVPAEDIPDHLRSASLFFLSSVDDPMPLSVGEALAIGIPVIVYRNTGYGDFVRFEKCGEVFDYYNEEAAYTAVERVAQTGFKPVDVSTELEALVGRTAFASRLLRILGEARLGSSPQPGLGPTLSFQKPKQIKIRKDRILEALDRTLPDFITKPGEKLLRKIGLI